MGLRVYLINDTGSEPHHGCALVMRRLEQLVRDAGGRIAARVPAGEYERYDASEARACDLVLINGEGTLHHDGPRARALIECIRRAREDARGPVRLVNATIHALRPEAYEALRACEALVCRESASLAEARSAGIAQATWCPDLIFLGMPGQDRTDREPLAHGKGVVVDSVHADVSAALWRMSRGLNADFISLLAPERSPQGRLSLAAFRLLGRAGLPLRPDRLRRAAALDAPETVMERIAQAPWVISGRFHATCLAVALGVPVLSVQSNSHKMEGLLEDLGAAELLLPAKLLTDAAACRVRIRTLLQRRGEWRERFAEYASRADALIRSKYASLLHGELAAVR
jgi:polysaccharide pyruvyl transferase WcaK-like protein